MDPVCLFCKTFRRDLERFSVLLDSVLRHNVEGIPFVVSIPKRDRRLFEDRFGNGVVEWVTDEALTGGRVRQSWMGQQVVKLSFWQMERASSAVALDADFIILRDFGCRDFIDVDGTPFFVASRHSPRYEHGDPAVRESISGGGPPPTLSRDELASAREGASFPDPLGPHHRWLRWPIRDLRKWSGRKGRNIHMMPGPILSHESQRTFHDEYLEPQGITYRTLIHIAPWEYVWLGEWLLARRPHDVRPIHPLFVHFVSDGGIRDARAQGITRESIARHHLGVALASQHQMYLTY